MAGERVLIVDDEKPLVDGLVPFLERAGFCVQSVLRGDTALACITVDSVQYRLSASADNFSEAGLIAIAESVR